MIQDIAPLKLNNAYHRKKPKNNSRMLGFFDRMIYLKYDEKIEFLTYEQWTDTRREQKKEIPESVNWRGRLFSYRYCSRYTN